MLAIFALLVLAAAVFAALPDDVEYPYKDRLGSDPHEDPLLLDNGQLKVPPLGWSGSRYYRCINNGDGTSVASVWNIPSHRRGGWYYSDRQDRVQIQPCGAGPDSVILTYDINVRHRVIGYGNTPQTVWEEGEVENVYLTAYTAAGQQFAVSACSSGCCYTAPLYNKTVFTTCSAQTLGCAQNANNGTFYAYGTFSWSDTKTFSEGTSYCTLAELQNADAISGVNTIVAENAGSWHYAAPYGNGTYGGSTVSVVSSSSMVYPAMVLLVAAIFALI